MAQSSVNATEFYGEYHGHTVEHLRKILPSLRSRRGQERGVLWLVGDSTLDNKYWLPGFVPAEAIAGYEDVLTPPRMCEDVAYWVNRELVSRGGASASLVAVNCSIEESTLGERQRGRRLFPQDQVVRDCVTSKDVVVVSCGGNDIALRPSVATIASMISLLWNPMLSEWLIDKGLAPGFGHFRRMFRDDTRRWLEAMVGASPDRRPRCVVVCMLYFLDEASTPSWASATLKALGYDRDPKRLQLIMRKLFEKATCEVVLEGVEVLPLPLYEALDGKTPADYVQRVEPSSQGGAKMARSIVDRISHLLSA